MNEEDARRKVQALKFFYGHLWTYAFFMAFLALINFNTYRQGAAEIWVVYPLVAWGAMVAAHGLLVHFAFGGGKRWEENKLRELMGWSATQQDLARLSERIETLLRIVSDERDRRLAPDLESARDRLLDAESAIRHYRAPLSETDAASMSKRDVIELVERLEALLTSRRFQQLDEAAERDVERDSAPKH